MARRREIKKRASDDEEDGNTESQHLLALRPLLKKPKRDDQEIKQFRAKAAADQLELKALLQQRLNQAEKEDAHRRNELTYTITHALQTPNHRRKKGNGEVSTFPNTTIASNVVFDSAGRVNVACQNLLAEYRAFEATVSDMKEEESNPVAENWARDVEETERLLRAGHKKAMKDVKKVLGAEGNGDGDNGDDGDEEGVGEELNYEFRKSLLYVERGVKRMVKGLPKEDA